MRPGRLPSCDRWRLSNKETRADRLAGRDITPRCSEPRRCLGRMLQPLLVAEGIDDLLALTEAGSAAGAVAAAHCRSLLAQPRDDARSAAAC